MNKQTNYLLQELDRLTLNHELLAKYEYNSDIDIHFVLLYSESMETKIVEKISNKLYENFVSKFPKSMVAVMDPSDKYKFRFEVLFDNFSKRSLSCFSKNNNTNLLDEIVSLSSYNTITISSSNIAANQALYNIKTVYKKAMSLKKVNKISNIEPIVSFNEEYAIAA